MALTEKQSGFVSKYLGTIVKDEPGGDAVLSMRALSKTRLEWQPVRSSANAEISRLKRAIFDDYQNTPDAQSQVSAAISMLDDTIAKLDDRLTQTLDAVLNASGNSRKHLASKARKTIAEYVKFVEGDAIMQSLDGNDILPEVQITKPIARKLKDMSDALGT